jgi:hypothetical protein
MTETAHSRHRPRRVDGLEDEVVEALVATGVVEPDVPVVSLHAIDIEHAYPIPTVDRDEALGVVQPWLMNHGIYSRGRFGSWRYEIGNMDHATKMGVDVARLLVEGRPEELWQP